MDSLINGRRGLKRKRIFLLFSDLWSLLPLIPIHFPFDDDHPSSISFILSLISLYFLVWESAKSITNQTVMLLQVVQFTRADNSKTLSDYPSLTWLQLIYYGSTIPPNHENKRVSAKPWYSVCHTMKKERRKGTKFFIKLYKITFKDPLSVWNKSSSLPSSFFFGETENSLEWIFLTHFTPFVPKHVLWAYT